MSDVAMWEILVPTVSNTGKPFRTRFHRVWDAKVREYSGGLTILSPAKGQWKDIDGAFFSERMIPVRIMCTELQIRAIISLTLVYYDQIAVLAYKISDNVILMRRDGYRG